jgi:prepilin peptidase CpaA
MAVKIIMLSVLIVASLISDIKTGRIKNFIVLPFIAAGPVISLIFFGSRGLLDSIAGILVPVVILFILYALKMLGAGDIKLFCAIGSIMGAKFAICSMLYSFIAGGIFAIFIMLARKNAAERMKSFFTYLKHSFLTMSLKPYTDNIGSDRSSVFCFSYAIAAGTLIRLLQELLQ